MSHLAKANDDRSPITDYAPVAAAARLKSIAVVVGTVPEAVKLGPVCQELAHHDEVRTSVILTGQHRDRVAGILQMFGVRLALTLEDDITRDTLSVMTSSLLSVLGETFHREPPKLVVVQGDTSSAFAAALAAFYANIPVAHVEAGLTTGNVAHPFPEELHREAISKIATLLFAPSQRAADHARKAARPGAEVFVTGNPCVDALILNLNGHCPLRLGSPHPALSPKGRGSDSVGVGGRVNDDVPSQPPNGNARRKRILITVHRRENHGSRGELIGRAIARLAAERPDAELLYVGHHHPGLSPLTDLLRRSDHVTVLAPQDYPQWLGLLRGCHFVLSDSGGAQEEAPWLGKPVLVLREETERQEVVDAGAAKLVGTDARRIYESAVELLDDQDAYHRMQLASSEYPYGRGNAAPKITRHLVDWMGSG